MDPALRRYLQLDVFAGSPGTGNPLGVVFDAGDMAPAAMQAFAAWTNLSETIFLLPPLDPGADYRVRIFTPRQELPFAGHPSVGAAWAALDGGLVPTTQRTLVQQCAAGLLPVRIADSAGVRCVHVRAPRAKRQPPFPPATALLDACVRDLPLGAQPAALWNNGPGWWLVELADENAVRSLRPDLPAITELTSTTSAVGLAVYARTPADSPHQLVVRAFCPADNIPEDPVTGSANACIAALLANAGALPGAGGRYRASQGREVGRDGTVDVEVDAAGDVWIGGEVQRVIAGSVLWPDDMRLSP